MKKTIASERLKLIRECYGLTREELAEELDVSPQVVANMELGRKKIYAADLEKLCDIFGMSSDQFLSTGVHVSRNLDIKENELINIYESVSKAGQTLMLNVCSEILKYEEMISTPRTLEQKKELLIAASGAEEDSDEIIDYNIELAKQIAEKEEKKRKKKKE